MGKMAEEGWQVQTFSYKINHGDVIYSMVIIVNTILYWYIWNLIRDLKSYLRENCVAVWWCYNRLTVVVILWCVQILCCTTEPDVICCIRWNCFASFLKNKLEKWSRTGMRKFWLSAVLNKLIWMDWRENWC